MIRLLTKLVLPIQGRKKSPQRRVLMNSNDIKQVRELLASMPDWSTLSLAEFRATYDQLGQQFPLPDGVMVEKVEAGGVSAEWVRAPNARADAVLLYLHGGG